MQGYVLRQKKLVCPAPIWSNTKLQSSSVPIEQKTGSRLQQK